MELANRLREQLGHAREMSENMLKAFQTPAEWTHQVAPFGWNPEDEPFGWNPQDRPFGWNPQDRPLGAVDLQTLTLSKRNNSRRPEVQAYKIVEFRR